MLRNAQGYVRSISLISGFTIAIISPYFQSSAYAGIIGNLDTPNSYVSFGSSTNFPWVGQFVPLNYDKETKTIIPSPSGISTCTSTLIHATKEFGLWALTAGHCAYVKDTDTGKITSYNSGAVYFGTGNDIDRDKYLLLQDTIVKREYVSSVNLNSSKGFLGEVEIDIALIKLVNPESTDVLLPSWLSTVLESKPLPQVPKTLLAHNASYIGEFVGVGAQGSGASGIIGDGVYSNAYLGGRNYVRNSSDFLLYDLDGLNPRTNFDGNPALSLEYSPTSGDSGSPIFIDGKLVGVHSRSQGG
ncbi:MAG: hypothetical protein SFW36_18015, partial [Leptolyngbyaceae cyanobacterium bins.59]|nr:hypothetical protein [Leptolyngbyaceae cyanobacterium bins.59]